MQTRSWLALVLVILAGCGKFHFPRRAVMSRGHAPVAASVSNPLFVSATDREFMWNQIVDEIDNYFRIQREQRVRMVGQVLMEGRIDTFPKSGATILEPWRRDSVGSFERLHATYQSIRRRAQVRVIPTSGGYLVEVAVLKELEDTLQPESTSVASANLRHNTTPERRDEVLGSEAEPVTVAWIPLGRDAALEQKILSNLRGRLGITGQ